MSFATRHKSAEPLSAHRLFQTSDIEVARRNVAGKFCSHELRPEGDHAGFEVCHNHAAGRGVSLNYLRYGSDVTINPGELTGFYLVQIPLRGRAEVRNGRRTVQASAEVASVLNPTRETRMTWTKGCEKLLLQIDREALQRTAERLLGRSLPQPVVFHPELSFFDPALWAWRDKLLASVEAAQSGAAFGAAEHRHQELFEEELIAGLLLAQDSSIHHMLDVGLQRASSAQVIRARSHILECLSDPLTIGEIAQAAGCSVRALQMGFKERFGFTPMQYLQRARLDMAHAMLRAAGPDVLVSDVAFDCGFAHLGRFSIAYRDAFGCSPKETLQWGALA